MEGVSEEKTFSAFVVGATGAVGSHIVEALLRCSSCVRLTTIGRRMVPNIHHEKLSQHIVDTFDDIDELITGYEVGFCALGTTMQVVAFSENEFRRVDHDLVLQIATAAHRCGTRYFSYVSSAGANSNSLLTFVQIKGMVEEGLKKIGFEGLSIFRPGLLLTKREETRTMEFLMQTFMPWFDWTFFGRFRKYRSVKADDVARATVIEIQRRFSSPPEESCITHENDDIWNFLTNSS